MQVEFGLKTFGERVAVLRGERGVGGVLGVPQSSTTNAFLALPIPALFRISNSSRILCYLDLIRS